MNIALNAVAFSPGGMGGVETYFRSLVSSLQAVDSCNEYYVICGRQHVDSLRLSNRNFHALACRYAKPSALWYLRAGIRHATSQDLLRPFMNRLAADIVHHPFSMLQPINHDLPSVLTFHDMQHEFYPEYFSFYALNARKKYWRPSAESATRIIAISAYVKKCLVEHYKIAPEKIDVVHTGCDPQFRPPGDPEVTEALRARYGLRTPFMYYPAATWPHKNHKRLLAVLRIMKDRYNFDGQLVLSGITMQAHDDVLRDIVRFGLQDNVVVLGYLPREDLPGLYSMAQLMVFPSLAEGFGIPLLEAMACGCPVACSNVTALPEIAADAALTFDPASVEDMAHQIWTLWNDESLRLDLKDKGLDRCAQFSRDDMARQTILVYEKALL